MARVLVIGDVHEPATHPGYLAFCCHLRDKYKTKRTVFIGDILDFHSISFHPQEPEAEGPAREADIALARVARWNSKFVKADVTIGNHDERVHRLASSVNIPGRFIRDYADVWQTPKWNWQRSVEIDDVMYHHGTGCGGQQPALNAAKAAMKSTVCGHTHSVCGIRYHSGPDTTIWGMDTGCGVDINHPAMAYGKHMFRKPILAAGVVLDGHPIVERMPISKGERFHHSRFRNVD